MNTKHTPGNWNVADSINRTENSRELAVWSEQDRVICLVSPKELENDEDLANAKLIAAAPEMLEALKKMRTYFGEHDKTMREHVLFAIADIAIKQATE